MESRIAPPRFSLSGHVSITLNSPFSVFERRRAVRVILHSVSLTFDGQTEVASSTLGYSPLRLYTLSRELLASSEPIELSNEDQEQTDEPCRWNVVFDLPIPGWLPASHDFAPGDVGASTRYYLHALVKFVVIEDNTATTWSFSSLCSPFRPRTTFRSLETRKAITLRRFVEPPTDEPKAPALVNFLLSPPNKPSESTIPTDVLSKVQVLASIPTHVDVCDDRFPFTLRLRTKNLEDAHCKRLHVTNFTLDVVQAETCRRATDASEYQARFPVPSQECQPPNKPLCRPHHMSDMYTLGLFLAPSHPKKSMRCTTSMLPAGETGVFQLTGDTRIFSNDAVGGRRDVEEWEGSLKVRPSTTSPLYDVSHSLKLTVRCEYEMSDGSEPAVADLAFTLPLTFGRVAPPLPPPDILYSMSLVDGVYPPMPSLLPYGANLPAYSQLFDSRGNRKLDSTPLPLYTPRSSTDSPVDLPSSNEKQDELHAMAV
ncbi:hypothetical protein MSAN_01022300 [Mycena sanguinolenta]|uniref:Uncharacterized protein n=1 Tax=Mycena sanguinolenta TaxID=230812 RepID=A0A8H6YSR1_9AGAR|nr:hypothetical protein MSAN_01022300 [Mycena sanguinolenta]